MSCPRQARITPVEIAAFAFSIGTVYGCGPEPVLYGLILLLGIPVYVWQRRERLHVVLTMGQVQSWSAHA